MSAANLDELQSPRLSLRRISERDLPDLVRMYRDPRVMATLGGVRSEATTLANLRELTDHWEEHGFGYWSLLEPESGDLVGRAGLRHIHIGGADEVEVGYGLMAGYWGRGLATEVARLCVRVAFEQLGREDLVCFTLTENLASRRVMEKTGFQFERDVMHHGLPHALCRLKRADWCDDTAAGSRGSLLAEPAAEHSRDCGQVISRTMRK